MNRRELLKLSLLTCGAALTSSAQGSGSPSPLPADDNASASPVLETSLGKLRGAFANGAYSFKGVHYGASTEGARRFQPPLPAKPWTGVRDALELGPPAPQYNGLLDMGLADEYAPLFQFVGPGTMSEDCLVLNVWTPTLRSGGKRPVMVWLHGGSFAVGSDGVPMFDGTNLSAKHDVVVVGVNHRLNAFGHLYLGKKGGERTVVSDLTYELRSGSPDFVDRMVAITYAGMAMDAVEEGKAGLMTGISSGCYAMVPIPDPKLGPRKVEIATMYNTERYRPTYDRKLELPIFLTRA
jgi:hypothetical protein